MKRLSKLRAPALAVGLAVIPACAGEAAYVAEPRPPPPRSEVVAYRPGQVWVQGHWVRGGAGWYWRDGYYVRERPRYVFVQPRWERHGRGYVYIEGAWRPRGRVSVVR